MSLTSFKLDLEPHGHITIERVVNGPIETNTYFVMSEGEAIAIDPAWEGEELARGFADRHPDVQVVAIACTHGHADHVGGVAGMREVLGEQVPYLLPADDVETVADSIASQKASWNIQTPDPGKPTRLLREGDVIPFGGSKLQVFSVPGHTPGGVVFFCAAENGNEAFVGDTLFPGGHGRTDLKGGDQQAIERSLAKMARLMPEDTRCMIGHGPDTTMERERRDNLFMRLSLQHGL